mgnify:CR=1 FL=1
MVFNQDGDNLTVDQLKVGIIGGGQLAEMLIPELKKRGAYVIIADKSPCPAEHLADRFIDGDPLLDETINQVCLQSDVISYEMENISVVALLGHSASKKIFPSADILKIFQNKKTQKLIAVCQVVVHLNLDSTVKNEAAN